MGHIAPVCRSKSSGMLLKSSPKTSSNKWLSTQQYSALENQGESLFIIQDQSSSQPYLVEFQVNVIMEVGTGVAVSFGPESV